MCSFLKILLISVVAIGGMVGFAQCQVQKQENRQEFAKRVRNFSFELLYHTSKALDNHLVISPFQIWSIMTVLSQGANGKSHAQLKRALNLPKSLAQLVEGYKNLTKHIEDSKSKSVTIHTGSFMFVDLQFLLESDFMNSVRNDFSTQLISADFKDSAVTAAKANTLISRLTEGRIPEALYPSDFQDSQLVITNAIDFTGKWTFPFDTSDTKKQAFFNEKGVQIGEVNMMYKRASFPFASVAKLQGYALELSYGEDKTYSMLLFLPHSEVTLADMFTHFQEVDLSQIFRRIDEDSVNFEGDELDLWLPRFKITTDVALNKPLNDLGIYDIFFPGEADLSRISKRPLAVSKVTQKAVLEVTEAGTTSSAATAAVLPDRIEPAKFMANRPFLYLIIERTTTTVLFGGIYSKPSLF